MLQVEYRHDIQKNYLVIKEREKENYMLHMLAGKYVQGFLPLEIREMDNQKEYYYDITGRENLSQRSNRESWRGSELKKCISQILAQIGKCREYLLNPDNLVLDPAYIYIDMQSDEAALCYVHDYNIQINEQLTRLFSYFMNVVDYQDKEAVQIVYKLYEISREPHCTLNDLWKIVSLETKKSIAEKVSPEEIEKESILKQKKDKISLVSGKKSGKSNKSIGKELEMKSFEEDKMLTKKKEKVGDVKFKKKQERKKGESKENIILTVIIQIALLLLLAVAAKSGIFSDKQGISVTKSVMGLFALGALDMFILGRVFAAEKQNETKENVTQSGSTKVSDEKECHIVSEDDGKVMASGEILDSHQLLLRQMEKKIPASFIKQTEVNLPPENENVGENTVIIDYDKTIIKTVEEQSENWQCYLVPEEQGREVISLGNFPFFIGRFQKDTGCLKKKKNISRMHSKIEQMGEQFFITDLNSTNGTFVNEKRIEGNQRIELVEGDKISFADIPYYFTKNWKTS